MHHSVQSARRCFPASRWSRNLRLLLTVCSLAELGCRNALGVPVPAGVIDQSAVKSAGGAEAARQGVIGAFENAYDVQHSGLLTDEFTDFFLQNDPNFPDFSFVDARLDERSTYPGGPGSTVTDPTYTALQQTRVNARAAALALARFGTPASAPYVGQMDAYAGYSELLLAEEFCAGVPLSDVHPGGGISYGMPLATDSLLARAVADFDSAVAHGVGNDTVLNLARVGLGRALLGRGQYAAAAAAVAAVPTGFQYAVESPPALQGTLLPNFYTQLVTGVFSAGPRFASVSDREGGNGLDFVSAHDPRMPIDSTQGPTPDGTPFYYPAKFPVGGAPPIPLADWIEARLIQAEGLLQAGNTAGWLAALNTLRADTADTHVGGLAPLTDPGTPSAQVDLMFRERAFWMFGTGHRLGDLRRLIRQYGRGPETVFPTGPYPATGLPPGSSVIPSYGTDVNFPIQAVESANPNFHGCLNHNA